MAGVDDRQLVKYRGWAAGLANVPEETETPANALRAAVNMDLTESGGASRRAGYTQRVASRSKSMHGTPTALYAEVDGELRVYHDRMLTSYTALAAVGRAPISFVEAPGMLYWTNGAQIGAVDTTTHEALPVWPSAPAQPTVAATAAGGLSAGRYQVLVTYVDTRGRESGAGLASLVSVSDGQGIALTNIARGQPGDRVRVYMTRADSETLYLATTVAEDAGALVLGASALGRALETQFMEPLPAGSVVRWFNGRLLVAVGRRLVYSQPFRYGLHYPENYVGFDTIAVVAPVGVGTTAGCFVADVGRTYFLSGANPTEWRSQMAYGYGAVPGSDLQVPASLLKLEGVVGDVPVWLSSNGRFVAGLPNGVVQPLSEDIFVAPANAVRAAALLRDWRGKRQVVTSVRGGETDGIRARDKVSAVIRRRGSTT